MGYNAARKCPGMIDKETAMDKRAAIIERAEMLARFSGRISAAPSPETLKRADTIASGSIYFYNVTPVEIGTKDIDWTGGQIAHQEWRAQLNRFFCLAPLASAYRETGGGKYAQAARNFIEDWIDFNAPFLDRDELNPGDNTLNLCIRLGTSVQPGWGGTLPVFLESPSFDDAFLEKMLDRKCVV